MQKINTIGSLIGILLSASILLSCQNSSTESSFDSSKLPRADQEEIDRLIEAFIFAEDGDTIAVPAGFYNLKTQLILDNKKDVTIKGAGMAETVLSFKELKSGGGR